jgi:hypothetical protein
MAKPERRDAIDPSTQALMDAQAQKAAERLKTPAERRRAAKEAQRSRLYLDLPDDLQGQLRRLAGEHDCSLSSLAAFLLHDALGRVATGALSIDEYRTPARSLRFSYVIEIPDESGTS